MSGSNRAAPHSALLKLCEDYLQARGAWTHRILGGIGVRRGSPDLVFAIRAPGAILATFGALEAKTGSGRLSAAQTEERVLIEASGGLYILARSVDDIEDALVGYRLVARRVLQPRREDAPVRVVTAAPPPEPKVRRAIPRREKRG